MRIRLEALARMAAAAAVLAFGAVMTADMVNAQPARSGEAVSSSRARTTRRGAWSDPTCGSSTAAGSTPPHCARV